LSGDAEALEEADGLGAVVFAALQERGDEIVEVGLKCF
jgi:hypothetical protein